MYAQSNTTFSHHPRCMVKPFIPMYQHSACAWWDVVMDEMVEKPTHSPWWTQLPSLYFRWWTTSSTTLFNQYIAHSDGAALHIIQLLHHPPTPHVQQKGQGHLLLISRSHPNNNNSHFVPTSIYNTYAPHKTIQTIVTQQQYQYHHQHYYQQHYHQQQYHHQQQRGFII